MSPAVKQPGKQTPKPAGPSGAALNLNTVTDLAPEFKLAASVTTVALDNTWGAGIAFRPFDVGADIVMHSGTKYLDGQGRVRKSLPAPTSTAA